MRSGAPLYSQPAKIDIVICLVGGSLKSLTLAAGQTGGAARSQNGAGRAPATK